MVPHKYILHGSCRVNHSSAIRTRPSLNSIQLHLRKLHIYRLRLVHLAPIDFHYSLHSHHLSKPNVGCYQVQV